ncbi:aminoglycoside phosphotransferase family protein [Priestia megaterium]
MTEIIERIINKIPELTGYTKIHSINKGFSKDEKWRVGLPNDLKYFVRVSEICHAKHKKVAFNYMKKFKSLGVPVSSTVCSIDLEEESKYIEITEFTEGTDDEEILPTLSSQEQFEIGIQAGEALKIIHSVQNKSPEENWDSYQIKKYNDYLEEFEKLEVKYFSLAPVIQYIDSHIHLLRNRPVHFLHDDFHPANIMVHPKKLQAVLDFDRYEWGDPIHDFHKIALFTRNISVPFAIGQIQGYFKGNPPSHFWALYTTYVAMVFVSDIVWSIKNTPNHIDKMVQRLNTVLDDHQNFADSIPVWYKTNYR